MSYELRKIESLISKLLAPKQKKAGIIESRDFDKFKAEVETEIDRIKQAFIDEVFNLKKDRQIERYVQQHQTALIRLTNLLIKQIPSDLFKKQSQNNELSLFEELCLFVYSRLEDILNFIENYFTKYFNLDEKIPARYMLVGQKEFREKVEQIKKVNNCDLVNIALYPIIDFINQNKAITFRKLIYLKELARETQNSCSKCNDINSECKLTRGLLYLNFNSFRFYTYLTTKIKNEYLKIEGLTQQIECLSNYLKKFNQIQVKPNVAFKPDQISIKDQVCNCILEEMSHLEKVYQLSLKFPTADLRDINAHFKIITDFSVPQVAYLIRLMIDTGIIQNSNHKEILSFFAEHLKTKKAENISSDSLRSKYYNVEEGTKEFVREHVIKLLNETQKQD